MRPAFNSPYKSGPSKAWLKIKNPKAPATTRILDGTFDRDTLREPIVECVMRNQTPLVPGQPAFDVTVYIVLNYYGSRLGRAYAETGDDEADEKTTIENILSGQYSDPIRVVAFNTAEGWARDVTEDIAQAVLSKAQHERRSISIAAQEFLVRTLGVDAPLSD